MRMRPFDPMRLPSALGSLLLALAATTLPAGGMTLGVQTHFSQGWRIGALDEAAALGTVAIRDSLAWARGEPAAGRYAVAENGRHLELICERGMDVMLTLVPENKNYDGGETVHTDEGRQAFARYVRTVLDEGPDCIVAIEVGNEINGDGGISGPAKEDIPRFYTALLREVYEELKPAHPDVAILGGSTNVIGTGFLERLFEAGALDVMDAVVVHPYRSRPEGVDVEFGRLREAMGRHGETKPIWATEFSDNYETPELAASGLVKMVALMSAAGIERAYWYALLDQRWFRNMGLLRPNGAEKPAAHAYELALEVLSKGPAVADDLGVPLLKRVVFGDEAQIVWGAPADFEVPDGTRVLDAQGRDVAPPYRVGEDPLVILGTSRIAMSPGAGVADSLLQYAGDPWSYLAATPEGSETDLSMTDWDWTSYFGDRWMRPLRIDSTTLAPSGSPDSPNRPVVRYTSRDAGTLTLSACFGKRDEGDGVDVTVRHNGRDLRKDIVTSSLAFHDLTVDVAEGDTLDVVVGPNRESGSDAVRYRLRLFSDAGAAEAVTC